MYVHRMVKNVSGKKLWRIRTVGSLSKKNFGESKSMLVQFDTFLMLSIDSLTMEQRLQACCSKEPYSAETNCLQ